MRRPWRRQWMGYDPEEVERAIALIDQDHQLRLAPIQQEHAALTARIVKLRARANELTLELAGLRSAEEAIGTALLDCHLRASSAVVAARSNAEQTERIAQLQLTTKEDDLARLQQLLHHFRQEIRALANRYNGIADGTKGVG